MSDIFLFFDKDTEVKGWSVFLHLPRKIALRGWLGLVVGNGLCLCQLR
jgi:hypothetical protein